MVNPAIALQRREKVEEFRSRHRIGLLTLLFTDIVGSTKLKQILGDSRAIGAIQGHHAAIRKILEGFPEGEEIGTAGDSFFIVFTRPSDAVAFSLLVQARMRALAVETGHPVLDRIGIHVGEVLIDDTDGPIHRRDLYGLQVDTCARVESLAGADQILMSRFAFDSARQILKGVEIEAIGPLSWLNHGPYVMKGVEEPIEICEVGEIAKGALCRPPDSEKGRRFLSADTEAVLGWRPAVDLPVPGTSWVLEKKLGEGGFGEVWLGRDKILKSRHVFKFCFRADRVRSLKREVTLFRLLRERVGNHPNIVSVEATYFDEPPFYIVVQHVEGADLPSWCATLGGVEAIPLATRLEIVAQAADGLQAAHDSGVIHRDVKPANILVGSETDGRVRVHITDFGIGQVVSEEALAGVTRAGFTQTIIESATSQSGTHLYMAPELFAGKPASIRSDIYALGVVLYQLVTCDFSRPVTTDWARQIDDPLLREDLEKCFAGNPQERFAGPAQLAAHLRALESRHADLAAEDAARTALERRAYRRGIVRTATVSGAVIAALILLALYATQQARVAERERQYAQQASAWLQAQHIEDLFRAGKVIEAVPYLASVLRQHPDDSLSAERLLSALSFHSFGLPTVPALTHESRMSCVAFSPDGKRVLTASGARYDTRAVIWDAQTGRMLNGSMRHGTGINSAAFSPDGRSIITASDDYTARVWNAETGDARTPPLMHEGIVYFGCFSPDSSQVVTGWDGPTAMVWDSTSGQLLFTLKHECDASSRSFRQDGKTFGTKAGAVSGAVYSPDGKTIMTKAGDIAYLWNAKTGEPVGAPRKYAGEIIAFSADGGLAAVASNNMLGIWRTDTFQLLGKPLKVSQPADATFDAKFSPDDSRILVSGGATATLWNLQTDEPVCPPLIHPAEVTQTAWSRDCQTVMTGSIDAARAWDAATGKPVTAPLRHAGKISGVAFSPDGIHAGTSSIDRTAQVWDIRPGGALSACAKFAAPLRSVQFSPDGTRLLVLAGTDVDILDAKTLRLTGKPLHHQHPVNAAEFSSDGKRIATASDDGAARVWSAGESPSVIFSFQHPRAVTLARFSPDGKRLATLSRDINGHGILISDIRIWDLKTGQLFLQEWLLSTGHLLEWSPDSKRIYTDGGVGDPLMGNGLFSAEDGSVLTNRGLYRFRNDAFKNQGIGNGAIFSRDGNRLTTFGDSTARIWDGGNGEPLSAPLTHEGPVSSAGFSPNGTRVVTASADETACIWDATDGDLVAEPLKHPAGVLSAEFSGDGRHVLTACDDGAVRVWDASVGQPVSEPLVHGPGIVAAHFSPDGRWIVSASKDGTVRLWDTCFPAGSMPSWFPELAEAIVGARTNERGIKESVPLEQLLNFKERFAKNSDQDFYSRWARWFFADRSVRNLSPSSTLTVADYVEQCLSLNTTSSLREANRLTPNEPRILRALGKSLLSGTGAADPEAAFLGKLAGQLETAPVQTH